MQKGDAMDAAERSERIPDIVIITGMSGSGRTQAMHVFEDMGYFCIDNLPPRLIAQLAELVGINTGVGRHLAVTCDLRSQGLFDELLDAVAALEEREMSCDIVFLEASDEVLIRRYSENRRRHPIAKPGETTADAIQRERLQLQGVRDRADMIIDTSRLRTSALRNKLRMAFSELSDQQLMDVHVFSFGFKHGMPVEADIMIDVRFLPNPFYDPEMRTMTGLDKKVSIPRRRSFGRLGHSCSIRSCPVISRRVSRSFLSPSAARAASTAALPLPRPRPVTWKALSIM